MANKPKNNKKKSSDPNVPHRRNEFQTPEYAFEPLIPYLRKAGVKTLWDSCCGEGYLVQWMANAGFDAYGTDLLGGYGRYDIVKDPLTKKKKLVGNIPSWLAYDGEVTNLPFDWKYDIMKVAFRTAAQTGKIAAFLVPSDVIQAGREFVPLYEEYGLEILMPRSRINYKTPDKGWEGSSAQMSTCWVTYGLNIGRFITYVHLNKPKPEKKPRREVVRRVAEGQVVLF